MHNLNKIAKTKRNYVPKNQPDWLISVLSELNLLQGTLPKPEGK